MAAADTLLRSAESRTGVTTTDVLKFVGVAAFLIDHYGYYFAPDENGWRLVGRMAAPIFFFLIGFARTRSVPWTWFAFGAALTALSAWAAQSLTDVLLNILLNFALLRLVVLPVVERIMVRRPVPLAMLVVGCILLIDATDGVLEYGTEGWLWAFFGLAHRVAQTSETARMAWIRTGLGVAAVAAYIPREVQEYDFGILQAALLAGAVIGLALTFVRFRRMTLRRQPPAPLAAPLRFGGRYSLEIYAITLFAMQFLAYAIAISGDAGSDGGGNDGG
ncbi:MAG TPA: TraX family protein [Microvirga sp.]